MRDTVYVTYADDGVTVTGVFANQQEFATTPLAITDPAITAFRSPNPVPQTVTPRQARLALNAAGLLDAVNAAVNAAGGETLITWEYATEVLRTDPLITTLGVALNLSSTQIDGLFTTASQY